MFLLFSHLAQLEKNALVYLSAAVSDFYIPYKDQAMHKIQSREAALSSPSSSPLPGLSLQLSPTPKMMGFIRSEVVSDK